jgi:hypothetical protein
MNFECNSEIIESSENENLEKKEKVENELSLIEKQYLIDNWEAEVIDGSFDIWENDQITNQELRYNLNESLMNDIKLLNEEWGVKLNKDLSEEEYIEKVRIQINSLPKKIRKDTHWDSWPKKMREDEGFNCVGATLLGINALKEKGIESYYGNPWGHVVNIAKLLNGKWMYIDLRNNVVKEISPEEISLKECRVLKINDEDIDYKIIPIYDNSTAVGSIIGNLSELEAERENEEGQDIYQNIKYKLFPEIKKIEDTEEMQIEKERIESIEEVERDAKNYLNKLPEEKRREVLWEIANKKESVKNSILGESFPEGYSDELQESLRLINVALNGISRKEIKEEAISRFLSKIDKL